ncbi:hydrogenase formation protein HypD [Candidatus Woesearchaeota archaeon]|nr:hydrogenase formation protein HypD [Candidatus Woesearchaeota archaeon]
MSEQQLIKRYTESIDKIAKEIERDITIMEVCGGHTNVIMRYGIREILPKNVSLISGPGCPVCVSSQHDVDSMIELAMKGVPIATYGDMLKVPGSRYSLDDARAKGGKVFEIYSTTEVIELKKRYGNIIFFGVGFETTAPMTTFLLKNNVCVYSVHKLIPPALQVLVNGDIKIDGFLDPGHVSAIIGVKAYRNIKVPQVVSGFSAERILRAIMILLEQIKKGKDIVVNGYPEVVTEDGNLKAQRELREYFYIGDSEWRGLGILARSGLEVKDDKLNAKIKYRDIIDKVPLPKKSACRCGEILRGLIEPLECPLYRKVCTPENPQGACMVSAEGSCAIYYRYGR